MAKSKNLQKNKIMTTSSKPQFVTKGNRVIPVYPGFEVVPGSQAEGSLLLIRDPQSRSVYRYISAQGALEVVNRALVLLEQKKAENQSSDFASTIAAVEKIKQDIIVARAVYQKISKGTALNGTTFRFVF